MTITLQRMPWIGLVVGLVFAAWATPPALAEKRLALVVGNSAYRNAPPLQNPANDANDMATALQRLGFEVISGTDLDYLAMRDIVRRFSDRLSEASVALVFYAGHGLQVGGKNYLVPVDARIETQADLDLGTIDLDLLLRVMEADTRTSIVFLDACRDNPLAVDISRRLGARSGAVSRGLAPVDSGVGTLIAFSTQPGNVALDGDGRNSPFTAALLKTIEVPGLAISDVMIDVRNQVLQATGRKQVPWDNSSLTGQFYFRPLAAAPAVGRAGASDVEVTFWNSIKDARNPLLFEAYLKRYPDGAFAEIATINVDQLKAAASRPLAPAPEQKTLVSSADSLREIRDRLYELNFDPQSPDAAGLKTAITEFETRSKLPATGEPSQGLLMRLREVGGLKPWGAIVYDKREGKWGMSWDNASRKSAVESARDKCGRSPCPYEISFFGTSCGAFALSAAGFSIVSRDDIQKAKQAALEDCGKRGKACRIVGASCADGTGRS